LWNANMSEHACPSPPSYAVNEKRPVPQSMWARACVDGLNSVVQEQGTLSPCQQTTREPDLTLNNGVCSDKIQCLATLGHTHALLELCYSSLVNSVAVTSNF
jgi:hypothetical protein